MRLGKVIGRVTLSQAVAGLEGARWLLVDPYDRERLAVAAKDGAPEGVGPEPTLVVYDALGGGVGQTIGFVEGREAASPFPEPIAIDAISAALVDEIFYSPVKDD